MVDFGSHRITIMEGDGSNARSLVKFPNDDERLSWPQVSPDGTMVAFGQGAIHIVDSITGEELGEVGDVFAEPEPAWYGNDTLIVD
jgi:hypothetical protein